MSEGSDKIWLSTKMPEEFGPDSGMAMVALIQLFARYGRKGFTPTVDDLTEGVRKERGSNAKLSRAVSYLAQRGMLKPLGSGRYRVITRLVQTEAEFQASQARKSGGE